MTTHFASRDRTRHPARSRGRRSMTPLTGWATGPFGLVVLAAGPLASVYAAPLLAATDPQAALIAATVAVAMWSPFTPLGVPALLLQDERDASTSRRGCARIGPVAWHLSVGGPLRVVAATWANLTGVAVAAAALMQM
jgi:hypothetical protein